MKSLPVAPGRVLYHLSICLILFLIAAVIVLALVPVYLTTRDVQPHVAQSTQFTTYLVLQNGYLPLGSMSEQNCAVIQNELCRQALANSQVNPSVPTVTSCTVLGNSTTNGRKKRSIGNLISVVVILSGGNCVSDQCSIRGVNAFVNLLLGLEGVTLTFFQAGGSSFNSVIDFISTSDVTLSPSSCSSPTYSDIVFYGVTAQNQLLTYYANDSSIIVSTLNITGLVEEDIITNIDYRVAYSALYGCTNIRCYLISTITGMARNIGFIIDVTTEGNITSFEIDPSADVEFYVTNINRTMFSYEQGQIFGNVTLYNEVESFAFDNNFPGTSNSSLYILNATSNAHFRANLTLSEEATLSSVSEAPQTQIGSGLGINITRWCGFDISPNGTALACVQIGNTRSLYIVDLNSGTLSRKLGEISEPILSISIQTLAVAFSIDASNNNLVYISALQCSYMIIMKNITGLQPNEVILGLYMDPSFGNLYALGNTICLYSVNSGPVNVTSIGSGSFTPALNGTYFGMGFNPVSGLVQVISDTGQQLLINATTGQVVQSSSTVNPATATITAIAFSNDTYNATSTTLYAIDSVFDRLLKQENPQLNGAFVDAGPLGIDVDGNNGFDIDSSTGDALALFTVNGEVGVYSINLLTGQATLLPYSTYSWTARALALGLNS